MVNGSCRSGAYPGRALCDLSPVAIGQAPGSVPTVDGWLAVLADGTGEHHPIAKREAPLFNCLTDATARSSRRKAVVTKEQSKRYCLSVDDEVGVCKRWQMIQMSKFHHLCRP